MKMNQRVFQIADQAGSKQEAIDKWNTRVPRRFGIFNLSLPLL